MGRVRGNSTKISRTPGGGLTGWTCHYVMGRAWVGCAAVCGSLEYGAVTACNRVLVCSYRMPVYNVCLSVCVCQSVCVCVCVCMSREWVWISVCVTCECLFEWLCL